MISNCQEAEKVAATETKSPSETVSEQKQNSLIEEYLNGVWFEAEKNEAGEIVNMRPRRGGFFSLEFGEDKQIFFKLPPTCGFGHSRIGTYKVDAENEMLNCHFTKTKGYFNTVEPDKVIDSKEQFKILHIEEKAMIFQAMDSTEKVWIFKKKETE